MRCTRETCHCPAPKDKAARAFLISDALWEKIVALLPEERPNAHRFGGGRPRACERRCMDAIFYRLRTGCQWKALSATGLCPSSTAHGRSQEWVEARVFERLWRSGLEEYDALKGIDWEWLALDGAMTKAPLGGEKNREKSHRPCKARGQTQPAHRGQRSASGGGNRRG